MTVVTFKVGIPVYQKSFAKKLISCHVQPNTLEKTEIQC